MEIALTAESASRIRAVLGNDVDLSPAAVPQALARLAGEAPDVYSEVLARLSGSDIRLDSERALHRRHRRTVLRRALFGWGEYESDAGDRLLAKRRVAAAVPIGLAAVMLTAASVSTLLHRPQRASTPPASVRVLPPSAPHEGTRALRQTSARGFPLWLPAAPERAAVRPSPQLPPVPALPVPSLPPDPRASGSEALPPSIVFNRVPVSNDVANPTGGALPRSPVIYARETAGDTAEPSPGDLPPLAGDASGSRRAPRKLGDQIVARLMTGIVIAAGVPPVPVIAQGMDGSTWLGYAAAEPDGRVHISFQAADRDGSSASGGTPPIVRTTVSGIALEPDQLSAGLSARLVVRHRTTAAAAISAVAQAASDYMQALAHAGQVTVTDGPTQVSVGTPAPGWTYAAARLADALNPQASGTIETLEVPAGTRCTILITGTP